VVVTTAREHVPDGPSALLPPSYSLVYPNDGNTSDGTVAFLLTGTIVKEKYTNTQYGFWYKDTTTTVYSDSGLHAFNGGAPIKTPGKPYAAALV
jgi:hypothetical protein